MTFGIPWLDITFGAMLGLMIGGTIGLAIMLLAERRS